MTALSDARRSLSFLAFLPFFAVLALRVVSAQNNPEPIAGSPVEADAESPGDAQEPEPPPPGAEVEEPTETSPSETGDTETSDAEDPTPTTPVPAGDSILDRPRRQKQYSTELRLSLEEAVRLALARNYDLRISQVDQRIRDRELIVERAVFDPFFTLGYDFSKNRRPTASFLDIGGGALQAAVQVNPFETTDYSAGINGTSWIGTSYSLRLVESGFDRPLASGSLFGINPQQSLSVEARFTQPLLKGGWYGYNTARLRTAANNQVISREDLEAAASDLVFQVEDAYWQLVFATRNFEAKDNALGVARENLGNSREKQRAGLLARADVTIVENQLALRLIELSDAETLLEDSRDALLQLLNQGGDSVRLRWELEELDALYDDIRLIPTTEPDTALFLPDRRAALTEAFTRRADYRSYEWRIENQRIQTQVAENELLPKLDLTGAWSQLGLDDSIEGSFDSLGTGRFYGWSVGVQLEIPLSQRGPKANLAAAEDTLFRLQLERQKLENAVVLDVDRTLRNLELLHEKILLTAEQVRLQERLYLDEIEKLGVGKSIPYTVAEIRNDLIDQQTQALRAQTDYMTRKAEFFKVTGSLLERYGVELDELGQP